MLFQTSVNSNPWQWIIGQMRPVNRLSQLHLAAPQLLITFRHYCQIADWDGIINGNHKFLYAALFINFLRHEKLTFNCPSIFNQAVRRKYHFLWEKFVVLFFSRTSIGFIKLYLVFHKLSKYYKILSTRYRVSKYYQNTRYLVSKYNQNTRYLVFHKLSKYLLGRSGAMCQSLLVKNLSIATFNMWWRGNGCWRTMDFARSHFLFWLAFHYFSFPLHCHCPGILVIGNWTKWNFGKIKNLSRLEKVWTVMTI